jgi:hypothetical protein
MTDSKRKMTVAAVTECMSLETRKFQKGVMISAGVFAASSIIICSFWLNAFDRTVKAQDFAESTGYTTDDYIYDTACLKSTEFITDLNDIRTAEGLKAVWQF